MVTEPVRCSWAEWDGEKVYMDGLPVPMMFFEHSYTDPENPRRLVEPGFSGCFPLENGAFAVFVIAADVVRDVKAKRDVLTGTFTSTMRLVLQDPEDPENWFPMRFVQGSDTKIEPIPGCKGFHCSGCWHDGHGVRSDPWGRDEVMELVDRWSRLEVCNAG